MKIYTFDLASKKIGTLKGASDIIYASTVYSSKLYPLDVHEGVGSALSMVGGRLFQSPSQIESVTASVSLGSSTMRTAVQSGYGAEQVQASVNIQPSTLRTMLRVGYMDNGQVQSSASLLGSTLVTKLVSITNESHSIAASINISSGTLA